MKRSLRIKTTSLGLCALLCAAPAFAGLEEGVTAVNEGHWDTAIAELTPIASANSPEAAALLGDAYRFRDSDKAVQWDLVAAQYGDEKIQYDMGVRIDDIGWPLFRYDDPRGKRYFRIAADCFQQAANRGYAPAQNALGMMYEQGLKLPVDVKRGVALYRAAARQGYGPGLESMAVMYASGRGVKRNLFVAYAFYLTAIRYANGNGMVTEYSTVSADDIEPHLSNRDIKRAKAIAAAWKPGQPIGEFK